MSTEVTTAPSGPEPASPRAAGGETALVADTPGPLQDFIINDLDSFNRATTGVGGARDLAGLYFYAMMDCLVELAHAVAADFFHRPQSYVSLDDELASILARLQVRSGNDETFLSEEQREGVYRPVFGEAAPPYPYGSHSTVSGTDQMGFDKESQYLIQAATAFAERAVDTGVDMLRRRVRATHFTFKQYLVGMQGASVHWSRSVALVSLTEETAYRILRNDEVARIFGTKAPSRSWPYGEDVNGDKLVAEISRQLGSGGMDGPLTRERFSNLQRNALRGAEALATVIDLPVNDAAIDRDVDLLIGKVYSWGSALRDAATK